MVSEGKYSCKFLYDKPKLNVPSHWMRCRAAPSHNLRHFRHTCRSPPQYAGQRRKLHMFTRRNTTRGAARHRNSTHCRMPSDANKPEVLSLWLDVSAILGRPYTITSWRRRRTCASHSPSQMSVCSPRPRRTILPQATTTFYRRSTTTTTTTAASSRRCRHPPNKRLVDFSRNSTECCRRSRIEVIPTALP